MKFLPLDIIKGVISVLLSVKQLHDQTKEIKPNQVYNTQEAARIFRVKRVDIIKLIKTKLLDAKLIEGNYIIIGQSMLEYLNQGVNNEYQIEYE